METMLQPQLNAAVPYIEVVFRDAGIFAHRICKILIVVTPVLLLLVHLLFLLFFLLLFWPFVPFVFPLLLF